jgi:hypothetical protein
LERRFYARLISSAALPPHDSYETPADADKRAALRSRKIRHGHLYLEDASKLKAAPRDPSRPMKLATLFCLAAAVAAANCRLHAANFSLTPAADAFISLANPANNYGGAGSLAVSAPGLPKAEFQSVLQFDLSPAKANFDASFGVGQWTLSSASLQLVAANPGNPLFNTSAAGQIAVEWLHTDAWTERRPRRARRALTGTRCCLPRLTRTSPFSTSTAERPALR